MTFDQILREATSSITGTYFNPPSLSLNASLRERVYCYELYHQLRSKWADINLTLHGEADKAGHSYAAVIGKVKPDFIVHRPGSDGGALIMEVKRSQGLRNTAIKADVEKLRRFSAYYSQFIFLVFGEECQKVTPERLLAQSSFVSDPRFQLWHHTAPSIPSTLQMGHAGNRL